MTNLFRAATTIAISAVTLSTVPAASAETVQGHINGYVVDIMDSGSYDAPDFITVFGPQGKEQITVTCAPFNWNSYGRNTETFVESIATAWCF